MMYTPTMQLVMALNSLQSKLLRKIDLGLSLHGISFTEFLVLHHLDTAPSKTLRRIDLAEAVGLSASGVTRLLSPMEKLHLVEKASNPRDARVSLVRLSATGAQVLENALVSFRESTESLFQGLDATQIAKLHELIGQLLQGAPLQRS